MDTEISIFKEAFGGYFNDAEFSDAVIVCESHEFRVHKVVLAAHSPVFKKAFGGDWKERNEGRMTIDDKAPVVEAILMYMYKFNYDNGTLIKSRSPPMVFHAQVYAMAELYCIRSLKAYSKAKFETAIASDWKLEVFPSSITEAFSTTPETDRGLRDPILKITCQNVKALIADGAFKIVLREAPGFAADFAEALAMGVTPTEECSLTAYKCLSCLKAWHGNFANDYFGNYRNCPHCGMNYQVAVWNQNIQNKECPMG